MRPQLTGSEARIRLSNVYGDAPLVIGAASVARVDKGAAVVSGTLRPVTFDGRPRVSITAGQDLVSDPVPLVVEAGRALAVTSTCRPYPGSPRCTRSRCRPPTGRGAATSR